MVFPVKTLLNASQEHTRQPAHKGTIEESRSKARLVIKIMQTLNFLLSSLLLILWHYLLHFNPNTHHFAYTPQYPFILPSPSRLSYLSFPPYSLSQRMYTRSCTLTLTATQCSRPPQPPSLAFTNTPARSPLPPSLTPHHLPPCLCLTIT